MRATTQKPLSSDFFWEVFVYVLDLDKAPVKWYLLWLPKCSFRNIRLENNKKTHILRVYRVNSHQIAHTVWGVNYASVVFFLFVYRTHSKLSLFSSSPTSSSHCLLLLSQFISYVWNKRILCMCIRFYYSFVLAALNFRRPAWSDLLIAYC